MNLIFFKCHGDLIPSLPPHFLIFSVFGLLDENTVCLYNENPKWSKMFMMINV